MKFYCQKKTLTDNNIEETNLEYDKRTIVDKVDKIIEKSLQDNCKVEIDAKIENKIQIQKKLRKVNVVRKMIRPSSKIE